MCVEKATFFRRLFRFTQTILTWIYILQQLIQRACFVIAAE